MPHLQIEAAIRRVALIALVAGAALLPDFSSAEMICQHRETKKIKRREACMGKYRRVLDLGALRATIPQVISAEIELDPKTGLPEMSEEAWYVGGTYFVDRGTATLEIAEGVFAEAPRCVASLTRSDEDADNLLGVEVSAEDATTLDLRLIGIPTDAIRATFICTGAAPSETDGDAAAPAP